MARTILSRVEILGGAGRHQLAIAQDGDAVGMASASSSAWLMNTMETPRAFKRCIRAKKCRLLFRCQRRRGFVEDDDGGVVMDGAGDLYHLPLGRRRGRDDRGRIDREVQRLQELLAEMLDAAQTVRNFSLPR